MNPLQYFLLAWYEHEPGALCVPLAQLLRSYNNLLDGDEHPRWRDRQYVASVLGRAFPIVEIEGQLMVSNLTPKRWHDSPYLCQLEALEVAA